MRTEPPNTLPERGPSGSSRPENAAFAYLNEEDFKAALEIPEFGKRKTARKSLQKLLDDAICDWFDKVDIHMPVRLAPDLKEIYGQILNKAPFENGKFDFKADDVGTKLLTMIMAQSNDSGS